MKKFEYKIVRFPLLDDYDDLERLLNELGADGWELVAIWNDKLAYLKREIQKQETNHATRL
ncbi:MAG: DUF4177 domain-containing protein [Oscillospiraceae bacterium]|jgi:hypothetical protein|nr:DUF4177 domain-containing protein [Oscillospiraceae bacterium]